MIERFILPEGLPYSPENLVRSVRGCSFNSPGNFPNRKLGSNKQVDMVWHDRVGMKKVMVQFVSRLEDGFNNKLRN